MSVGPAGRAATTTSVVLASGSRVRARLLEDAGVEFITEPAGVDEREVKSALRAEGASASEVAEALAELKAVRVSLRHPGALVVGADQMLVCDGTWFDKPADRVRARADLMALRGRTHELACCACVARDGARLWHHPASARLTMRAFSDRFIDRYLEALDETALDCVGVYQLEGLGAQLFEEVDGDFFSILGLPLLPLLAFLRTHEVVPR